MHESCKALIFSSTPARGFASPNPLALRHAYSARFFLKGVGNVVEIPGPAVNTRARIWTRHLCRRCRAGEERVGRVGAMAVPDGLEMQMQASARAVGMRGPSGEELVAARGD